jgi:predicted aspartyl protease
LYTIHYALKEEIVMGEVVEKITLVNVRDAGNARSGYIPDAKVRQVTVDAVVDTGAGPLIITEALRKQLGLDIETEDTVLLAGKVPQKCTNAEAVKIVWKGRFALSCPIVLPDGDETLLGVIPLEDMDVMVNPVDRRLEGVHGDKWVRQVRRR